MPPPFPPILFKPTPTIKFDSDIKLPASFQSGSLPSTVGSRSIDANLLGVVTTTVFVDTGPTVTAKPSSSSKVPIGAIVGGLLGGVAIALLTVGGWIWWGKIIERRAERDRKRGRKTSTTSSIERGNGSTRHISGSINGKNTNGRESARTSKRSLQQGVHPFVAAATASQKSVTFADDETPSAATVAANRDNSEVKISISIAEKDKPLNQEAEKDIGNTTSPPVRGFSIRSTPTPPPPARRSHSAERGYIPTRRSPLGQSSPSPSPSPSLSARKRIPSAPQPGTGEALGKVSGTETGTNDKHRSSPPAARSLSVLPIFGTKDAERGREHSRQPPSPSSKNNTKLFLTRTPVFKSHPQIETHTQNQDLVSTSLPASAPSRSIPSPVPPSPAKASVSLTLPGGTNLPSLNSLPLSPSLNPGSVNEALAALASLDMTPLSQPRPAFRQGTYASSSITQTNSSGVSGASESLISAPSSYSQSGTATDIDPRIANRR